MRTMSSSFLVTFISTHEPRSGMMRQECIRLSPASVSTMKSTPGDR